MHNLLLQSDVTVPSTTTGQYTIAAFVTLALLILAVVLYRRSKVLGLDAENRRAREEARAQRRRTAAAELKLSVDTVADLSSGELRQRLLDLFDTDAEATVTRLPAVVKRIAGAVDEAWGDRVGWLPTLARRAIGLASMVVVFGAVAVSGNAVVALLRSDPSTPGPESFVDTVTTGARSAVDIVGSYPYAGTFWELGYASLIISVQWLYEQWALVAIALVVSAVSIILLTHRLDDEAIPERLVQSPRLAAGADPGYHPGGLGCRRRPGAAGVGDRAGVGVRHRSRPAARRAELARSGVRVAGDEEHSVALPSSGEDSPLRVSSARPGVPSPACGPRCSSPAWPW